MHPFRKSLIGAALVGTTLTGGALGATLLNGSASAATSTASAAATTATTAAPAASSGTAPAGARPFGPGGPGGAAPGGPGGPGFDPTKGGHVGANGVTEVLLTGDTATKVRAAATAAVPGGTILRVETDAEGSPYEAHMTKADGSAVTVKVDAGYKVTSVDTDPAHP